MAENNSEQAVPRISALFSEMRDAIGDTTTDLIQQFYDNTLSVVKKAVHIAESESDTTPMESNSLTLNQMLEKLPSKEIEELLRSEGSFPPHQFKKPFIKV